MLAALLWYPFGAFVRFNLFSVFALCSPGNSFVVFHSALFAKHKRICSYFSRYCWRCYSYCCCNCCSCSIDEIEPNPWIYFEAHPENRFWTMYLYTMYTLNASPLIHWIGTWMQFRSIHICCANGENAETHRHNRILGYDANEWECIEHNNKFDMVWVCVCNCARFGGLVEMMQIRLNRFKCNIFHSICVGFVSAMHANRHNGHVTHVNWCELHRTTVPPWRSAVEEK